MMKLSEKIQEYADSNYSEYWRLLYEIWANNARQLESQNAELLEALEMVVSCAKNGYQMATMFYEIGDQINNAINKAKEK